MRQFGNKLIEVFLNAVLLILINPLYPLGAMVGLLSLTHNPVVIERLFYLCLIPLCDGVSIK